MENGADHLHKGKRKKLLRGLQRISSSPSLRRFGRARSSSSPYSSTNALSCVSLTSSPSPFGQPSSSSSYFSHIPSSDLSTAPTSIAPSPSGELSWLSGDESGLPIRKIEHPLTGAITVSLPAEFRKKKTKFNLWGSMPSEIKIRVLSFLSPKQLVRASRASKDFHHMCFDGQLWTCFDASKFYQEIPAGSLAKIIEAAGPFVKDLNLRGCVQVEHYNHSEALVKACKNLTTVNLEGCRNIQRTTLHSLLKTNSQLISLNLTGLPSVHLTTCKIISRDCPQLESFNVSGCKEVDARGIRFIVEGCRKLRDLRASAIRGFGDMDTAKAIFETNNLEKLALSGCTDLTDAAFRMMILGPDPEFDILSGKPLVTPRKLRHLDLTKCSRLTENSVKSLADMVPDLEALQLSGLTHVTDAALEPILASVPRLTHLEVEDLNELTNTLFSQHLVKAPCAPRLEHLSISSCENIGDTGMLPVFQHCTGLKSVYMDNTRISDLVLAEAATMVRQRSLRKPRQSSLPVATLNLVIYDTNHVTWAGVLQVLSTNAELLKPRASDKSNVVVVDDSTKQPAPLPAEIITMKCFHTWQMTVNEHTRRVLKGDLASANALAKKWVDHMQTTEEAGFGGRRRRRRAREAQQNLDAEGVNGIAGGGRRRAATTGSVCAVM
ncbi:hypothetical protein QBC35DRAFT_389695 [Podospora australis]|uniref:F-box domain-containing protein n=1 Tax=Podospora australis TaxID=1536484 RepID=A0AAN7AG29_9PEZI|nr:hypothetical protein QBC35DRAFT_389695 [Podospora australis]